MFAAVVFFHDGCYLVALLAKFADSRRQPVNAHVQRFQLRERLPLEACKDLAGLLIHACCSSAASSAFRSLIRASRAF